MIFPRYFVEYRLNGTLDSEPFEDLESARRFYDVCAATEGCLCALIEMSSSVVKTKEHK